jgi:hypothetical protein
MRMVQFVGYARNTNRTTSGRNIIPYANLGARPSRTPAASKLPLVYRLIVIFTAAAVPVTSTAASTSRQTIPKFYRRVYIRKSKFNVDYCHYNKDEEFDYRRYNKTPLIAIEAQLTGTNHASYCTVVLLVNNYLL